MNESDSLLRFLLPRAGVRGVHVRLHHSWLELLAHASYPPGAQRLEALADVARGAQRHALLADAAFAWHEADDQARARSLAAQVDPRRVTGASRARAPAGAAAA